jgi:uncharacterized SAM-binding protein YcdF (DUF218 family)
LTVAASDEVCGNGRASGAEPAACVAHAVLSVDEDRKERRCYNPAGVIDAHSLRRGTKQMSWSRVCECLGLAGITLFVVFAFTPAAGLLRDRLAVSSRIEPAEAIVVLGGGLDKERDLSNDSLRRTLRGIELQRRGLAPLLVLLGPTYGQEVSEAEVRAKLAREMGVPSEAILMEPDGKTTREEAIRVRALLQPRNIIKILLVTNAQHMARARPLFEREGFEVFPAPVKDLIEAEGPAEGRLLVTRRILQELAGRTYYRLAGYM